MKKQVKIKGPQVRSIKIHKKFRKGSHHHTLVPEIRLTGNWLQKAGFEKEKRILVTTMNKLIIITIQEE